MGPKLLAISGLLCVLAVQPAFADECRERPNKPAKEIHKKLKVWMKKKDAVQYTGYMSKKVLEIPNLGCAERKLFQALLDDARDKLPESKMTELRSGLPVLHTDPSLYFPISMSEQGKNGDCLITFDLPRAGSATNIKANCDNEGFVESAEQAVATMVFSPLAIDDEFIPQEGVTYPLTYILDSKARHGERATQIDHFVAGVGPFEGLPRGKQGAA